MFNLAHILLIASNLVTVSDASGGTVAHVAQSDADYAAQLASEAHAEAIERDPSLCSLDDYRAGATACDDWYEARFQPTLNTCEQYAELRYAMAESAGAVADAAWEDAWASCRGAR